MSARVTAVWTFRALVAAAFLVGATAEAKRAAPKAVAPVVADGVRYTAPHFGALRGKSQNGGFVEAEDSRTGELLWSRMIYRVRYDANREKDVQDVFIAKLKVKDGRLVVKTERAEEFEMDLITGRVRALTPLKPHVEVPSGASGPLVGQGESTGSVVADAKKSWTSIAGALTSSGYSADFTPASLWEIDRFFDEQAVDGKAIPRGLLSEHLGARLFAIGVYVGEVIRRARGGEWVGDDGDPEAEINVQVLLSNGTTFWPVQRVMKRFKNGSDDGIAGYASALGLEVGPRPAQAERR